MEEVRLVCGNCGEETFRPPKPESKNAREAKQVLFHCKNCGARNLRDRTVIPRNVRIQDRAEERQDEPTEKPGGISGILALLFGLVSAGIAAAIFVRRPKPKPQEPGEAKPGPFDPVH